MFSVKKNDNNVQTFSKVRIIIIFFYFLISTASVLSQNKDYAEIRFKSKLRNYTKIMPKTKGLGIDKNLFVELVNKLTVDSFNEHQKKELANKLWLAISNPQKFDFIYKDYSLRTIKNWGVKIKFEDPNFEPNPYLAKWTNTGDDFLYFQWAITQILTYEKLLVYSEKAKVAHKNIHNLLLLKGMKFYSAKSDEYAYDYLNRNNQMLKGKGLVILIYNNNFDFLVCKITDKEKVTELLSRLKMEFVAP